MSLLSHFFSSIKNFIAPLPYDKGHDSRAIANIFIQKYWQDKRRAEILSLGQLVYIAHGWKLGHTGKPLITESVQPGLYGPFLRQVHYSFNNKLNFINKLAQNKKGKPYTTQLSEDEQRIVDNVYKNYSVLSFEELVDITAAGKGTPWIKSYVKDSPIDNNAIQRYYKRCVERLKSEPLS